LVGAQDGQLKLFGARVGNEVTFRSKVSSDISPDIGAGVGSDVGFGGGGGAGGVTSRAHGASVDGGSGRLEVEQSLEAHPTSVRACVSSRHRGARSGLLVTAGGKLAVKFWRLHDSGDIPVTQRPTHTPTNRTTGYAFPPADLPCAAALDKDQNLPFALCPSTPLTIFFSPL
jgi:hypothetical protein